MRASASPEGFTSITRLLRFLQLGPIVVLSDFGFVHDYTFQFKSPFHY